MKVLDLILQLIRDYFVIFGVLVIGSVFLAPSITIDRNYIILTMIFAVAGDLPILVFWSKKELSVKSMRLRSILHFVLLECVVLIFAGFVGIVSEVREYFLLGVQILSIYLIVKVITWQGDRATAEKINNKLKHFKLNDENR